MAKSLGILLDEVALTNMIKEADIDGNGEIDFREFVTFMEKSQGGSGLSTLANRKKNGPPMKWRVDKCGPKMVVDGDSCSRDPQPATEKEQWGVQLLDVLCSSASLDTASVLFECSGVTGSCFIGVVSSNFQGSRWNESLDLSSHAVVVRADGTTFRKGVNLGAGNGAAKLISVKGCYVQIDLFMHEQRALLQVLGPDHKLRASLHVDELPVEVAVAVAFGPSEEKQYITLVGSSTEKTPKPTRVETDDRTERIELRSSLSSSSNAIVDVAATL